jgi:hypothetical protein
VCFAKRVVKQDGPFAMRIATTMLSIVRKFSLAENARSLKRILEGPPDGA